MPGGGSFGDDAARVSQLEKVVELYKQQLDEMQRDSQEAEERIVQEHGLVKQAVLDEVQALLKEKLACTFAFAPLGHNFPAAVLGRANRLTQQRSPRKKPVSPSSKLPTPLSR